MSKDSEEILSQLGKIYPPSIGRTVMSIDMDYTEQRLRDRINQLEEKLAKAKQTVDLPKIYSINPQKRTTALIFPNGTKTVVKKAEDDEFNPRLAFLTAFFQHYCGMTKNKANKYLASLETVEEAKEENIIVKVTNLDEVYSTYEDFIDKYFPKYKKNWKRRRNPKKIRVV